MNTTTKAMQTGDTLTMDSREPPVVRRDEKGRAQKEAEVAHILCGMQLTTGSTKPESSSSKDGAEKDADTKPSTVTIAALKNSSIDGARSDTANVDPVGSIDPTSACINRFPVVSSSTIRAPHPNMENKALSTFYPSMPPLVPVPGQQGNPADRQGLFNNYAQVNNVSTDISSNMTDGSEGGSKKPLMALGSARVTDLDVLLGRGGMTNKHPGNVRFRALVDSLKPTYLSLGSSKKKKKLFSETLMHKVLEYGGRFLVCHQGKIGMWTEADLATARKKCSQALREGKVHPATTQASMPDLPTVQQMSSLRHSAGSRLISSDKIKIETSTVKKNHEGATTIKTQTIYQEESSDHNTDASQGRKRKVSTDGDGTNHSSNATKMQKIDENQSAQKAFGQALVESALKKVVTSADSTENADDNPVNTNDIPLKTTVTNVVESTKAKPNEKIRQNPPHPNEAESSERSLEKPYSDIVQAVQNASKTVLDKPYSDIVQGAKNEPKTESSKKAFGQDIVESASKLVPSTSSTPAEKTTTSVPNCGDSMIKMSNNKEKAQNQESSLPANAENTPAIATSSQPIGELSTSGSKTGDSHNQPPPTLPSQPPSKGSNGKHIIIPPKEPSNAIEDSSGNKGHTINVSQKGNALSTGNNDYTRTVSQHLPAVWNNFHQGKMQPQSTNNHTQNHIVVNSNMNIHLAGMFHPNTTNSGDLNFIPPTTSFPQKKIAVIPTENDVLLGRGGFTNKHSGNIRFRDIVAKEKERYNSLGNSKKEKKRFSEHIVNAVHSYGGRFLSRDDSNRRNEWIIADPKAARKKCSQALRE